MEEQCIAGEDELLAFSRTPESERQLTPALRGVLAETALTGRIRYKWILIKPLVEHLLEKVLYDFDVESAIEVGPSKFSSYGESVPQLLDRFRLQIGTFHAAPWTLQRLVELLLEPQKQYSKLHKVALAVDKLLLVTSEVLPDEHLPPPPTLASLGPINENPAPVYTNGDGAGPSNKHRGRDVDDSGMGFVAATLQIRAMNSAPDAGDSADVAPSGGPGEVSAAGGSLLEGSAMEGVTVPDTCVHEEGAECLMSEAVVGAVQMNGITGPESPSPPAALDPHIPPLSPPALGGEPAQQHQQPPPQGAQPAEPPPADQPSQPEAQPAAANGDVASLVATSMENGDVIGTGGGGGGSNADDTKMQE